ncbi:bifunctional glutamate--cysteine ligase GshA/glutathione synthetase GshB [Carboxylicivirga sp. M1479]|uniref:bifunctional glutamate--cysteine ligase GshA/glutathione synthetase GshB n=1 Tax=Carboxylicivirga sp. M1479 TaxID=2594476 RepID=UPI001178B4CD|nr:bifunctional glutamate--cysteine ligase GshA/glutathione synthetase GshB [Carboxylicivirga sp. M1479]TRX66057.1 bifunctional glutamate--cysteine ligase GshA/glutathione synthetase GshB [Carboxylicivirga sp. M1479]
MEATNINIDDVISQNASSRLFEGGFGFEKENVRVTLNGELAQTPHPAVFGNKREHPYITTDFSESQVEMITPVRHSVDEAIGFLETLHDEVSLNLDNELLWPQSTPPILPEQETDIPIAKFDNQGSEMEAYRNYLAENYGRKKQLLSGVHFNISFDEVVLKQLYKTSEDSAFSYEQFREQVYLKSLRNFKRYRWFLIALLGNSPVVHSSYANECVRHLPKLKDDSYRLMHAGSMRNSMCGYRNKENLCLNYNTFKDYHQSVDDAIEKGLISQPKENYASIRIKSLDEGETISHLEIRLLDLNPFVKSGVDVHHARIIHQFLVYCLLKPELNVFDIKTQDRAYANHEQAASFIMDENAFIIADDGKQLPMQKAIELVLNEIEHYTLKYLDEKYQHSFAELKRMVVDPTLRPAVRMLKELKSHAFVDWTLNKAKLYLQESVSKTYNFWGLEDMELSTQLIMREALIRGVEMQVMDKLENFIKLSKNGKTEFVMQATRTSLDNYVSVLLMENKVMTKKVLQSAGINAPEGLEFIDANTAHSAFDYFSGQAIVIKPKSTNFGLGITILKQNDDKQLFERAVAIAFEHDSTILVEKFISGKEYRMFLINDELVGILHRVPANVIGNGQLSIGQLISKKNKDPLRGKGYKSPLEKIAMGEAEAMFLQTQGLDFDSVPADGVTIYLRENSNISTGGDSIDFTDDVHESYKEIAVEAAKALNVKVTGLDMMIDDISKPATQSNYSIIEMNFNPAIHIHCHPYIGKNRRLNAKMLDALGF